MLRVTTRTASEGGHGGWVGWRRSEQWHGLTGHGTNMAWHDMAWCDMAWGAVNMSWYGRHLLSWRTQLHGCNLSPPHLQVQGGAAGTRPNLDAGQGNGTSLSSRRGEQGQAVAKHWATWGHAADWPAPAVCPPRPLQLPTRGWVLHFCSRRRRRRAQPLSPGRQRMTTPGRRRRRALKWDRAARWRAASAAWCGMWAAARACRWAGG